MLRYASVHLYSEQRGSMTVKDVIANAMTLLGKVGSDESIDLSLRVQAVDSYRDLSACQESLTPFGPITIA